MAMCQAFESASLTSVASSRIAAAITSGCSSKCYFCCKNSARINMNGIAMRQQQLPLATSRSRMRRRSISPTLIHLHRGSPAMQQQYHTTTSLLTGTSSTCRLYATADDDSNEESANNDRNDDSNSTEIAPTWTYTPYKPPPPNGRGGRGGRGAGGQQHQHLRQFSSTRGSEWKVPNKISIPEDRLEVSFVRSSGAGGQNVNKLSTKVEIRFLLEEATWIPGEVRDRIKQNEANRMNKDGYLTVTSQEYRTQAQNRKDAIKKLENIILNSYPRPKVRMIRTGVSRKAKERNKESKKRNSLKKANRRRVDI